MAMRSHEPRRYRRTVAAEGLVAFEVAVGESDLLVLAEREMRADARAAAREVRRLIESHGALHPEFLEARTPLPLPDGVTGPVAAMYEAARRVGTGPMAAVAGTVAEHVARALAEDGGEVIVENGGDLYLITATTRVVAIDAGRSAWSGRLGLAVPPGERAVCTSSGTVGHSASAGRADAVVIAAGGGAEADAIATAAANRVRGPDDVEAAVEWARERDVEHVLVICGEALATWGALELRRLGSDQRNGSASARSL
ncbi:MAG: UPF0280 family protein [Armatimonadota bacterium]|nr:UPF0280 family protein [Armatimonadota bacterium]